MNKRLENARQKWRAFHFERREGGSGMSCASAIRSFPYSLFLTFHSSLFRFSLLHSSSAVVHVYRSLRAVHHAFLTIRCPLFTVHSVPNHIGHKNPPLFGVQPNDSGRHGLFFISPTNPYGETKNSLDRSFSIPYSLFPVPYSQFAAVTLPSTCAVGVGRAFPRNGAPAAPSQSGSGS